jgi:aldehyde dehydrogenase (NAD+)
MQVYKNFIGGEFVQSTGSKRILNTNPADTRDILGEVVLSTKEEAAAAVDAAAKAFKSWKRMPAPKRGAIVAKAAQLMGERRQ